MAKTAYGKIYVEGLYATYLNVDIELRVRATYEPSQL